MNFDPKYLSWSAPFFASEDWMREEFGVWQQSIRVLRADEVTISFAEVQWIDPLVLMSLLAESVRAYAKGNIKVLTLDLGRPGFAEHSAFESRTRKYIVQHRWLAAFCKALPDSLRVRYHANESDVRVEVSGTDVAGIQKIERQITSESGSSLLYNSDLLIEPTAIFAADWESAVGDAIQRVDEAYFRRSVERRALRGTTLQRLRAVMRELVRNSIEHAYPPRTPEADLFAFEHRAAPVIIYARTRRGSEAGRSLREDHRPQTTGAILEPSASDQFWIEACVVDVGKGIWTDAPQWASDSSIAKELRRSISKLCRSANPGPGLSNLLWHTNLSKYSRDLESKAVAERGRITGLFYLNSVLSVSSDWSNWYSDRTWRYSVHPVTLTKGQLKQAPDGAVGMQGTCFRICLNVAEFDTTLPPSWFVPSAHPDLMMKVARRLERDAIGSEQAVPFLSRPLLDLRHARERDANDELPVVDFFRVNTANEVVVRVPRAFDKNRFVSCVNAWLATLSTASYSHNTARLIVADVSRAQAKNFELVFGLGTELTKGEWLRLAGHKFPQDSILVVLADDLSCFAVKFQAKQDISAKGEPFCIVKAESYVLSDVSAAVHTTVNAPSLEELLASTLARLRERDSVLFWARVAELQPTADACLWGPVEWHSGGTEPTVLDHYLDFSAAMKDSELSKYLRRSLRRTLALVPGSHLECVDSLVEAEIADAIRWFANNEMFDFGKSGALRISKSRRIVVGSVRVTGATLRMLYRLPGQKPAAVIDCFVQPVASRQSEVDPMHEIPQLSVLSWNPGPIPHAEGIRYEQELGTPYIRRVPAKLRSVVSIDAKPRVGSAQPASDMYRQFVADGLIKIGHWYYGDRHSLLEVDTASAINNFASTHAAQIDEQFFGWLRNVLVDTFRNCPDNGTVAYVPQRLTQSIVRHFKLRNPQLPYRFVPIHLFSGIAGGVDQLSDMTLHALQVARADANGEPCSASVPVVVLDVGFISKRTLRHVRRQLAVAGVKKTVAVGLMNRSSSPAHADEESRQRLYTYWRWNIPV